MAHIHGVWSIYHSSCDADFTGDLQELREVLSHILSYSSGAIRHSYPDWGSGSLSARALQQSTCKSPSMQHVLPAEH
jgi:hypothetical protein